MTKTQTHGSIQKVLITHRIIPVITIYEPEKILGIADALCEAGLPIMEITLRTPMALRALHMVRMKFPEMCVGAGTVRRPSDLEYLHEVGASFAVSPGTTPALVEKAQSLGLPFLPGIATPSEVLMAMQLGVDVLKVFPAEGLGGVSFVRMLSTLFPGVAFCPTGGIQEESAIDYLRIPSVFAVGGSWMCPRAAIESGDWKAITHAAQAALASAHELDNALEPEARCVGYP